MGAGTGLSNTSRGPSCVPEGTQPKTPLLPLASLWYGCPRTGRLSMDEPNLQTVPKPLAYLEGVDPPLTDGSGTPTGHHRY